MTKILALVGGSCMTSWNCMVAVGLVEHRTSNHWVPGSKPGKLTPGALSSYSLPGARSVAHKTLAVTKRR